MLFDCVLSKNINSMLHLGMPLYQFPSEVVYWTRVKEHENIKSKLLQKIDEIQATEKLNNPFDCTMTTNFGRQSVLSDDVAHNFLDQECIQKMFVQPFKEFLNDTNVFQIKPKNFTIYQYWFNKYNKGDFQELHDHSVGKNWEESGSYPMLSGIYILKSDDEPNSTTFEIKNKKGIPFHPTKKKMVFDTSNVDDIKEGTLILFSSTLSHMVKPIKTSGRVTIAFNIACTFDSESDDSDSDSSEDDENLLGDGEEEYDRSGGKHIDPSARIETRSSAPPRIIRDAWRDLHTLRLRPRR